MLGEGMKSEKKTLVSYSMEPVASPSKALALLVDRTRSCEKFPEPRPL